MGKYVIIKQTFIVPAERVQQGVAHAERHRYEVEQAGGVEVLKHRSVEPSLHSHSGGIRATLELVSADG